MANRDVSPDEKRAQHLAKFDVQVVRLEDELDRMIKLVAMQRDTVEKVLFSGFAYKQEAIDHKGIAALKNLTAAYNSLTDAKIRLDKTAKERAAKMTPDEEKEAVIAYVKSLPASERVVFLRRMVDFHNQNLPTNYQLKRVAEDPDESASP